MNGERDAILTAVRRRTMLCTGGMVCLILLLALAMLSLRGYRMDRENYRADAERVAELAADGVIRQIGAFSAQPVNVTLTIASDRLLMELLSREPQPGTDAGYETTLQDYLERYRLKYGFDTVFLASAASGHYYYGQTDTTATEQTPAGISYNDLVSSGEEYDTAITSAPDGDGLSALITCKIRSDSGVTLGVVGVSASISGLQEQIGRYEAQNGLRLWLVDSNGVVQLSSAPTGVTPPLFLGGLLSGYQSALLSTDAQRHSLWYGEDGADGYAVGQYIPFLKWHLVVSRSAEDMEQWLGARLALEAAVLLSALVLVLAVMVVALRRYGHHLLTLTVSQELEYQRLLQSATEGLYENIFEWDITHDSVSSKATRQYLKDLGTEGDLTYEEAIHLIAEQQVKQEHIPGYLDTYSRAHVLDAFQNGLNNLSYDFLKQVQGGYQWTRLNARLFFWNSDQSVRMLTYRQNIDEEKNRELLLIQQSRQDALSGLLNKHSAEEDISAILREDNRRAQHAMLLLDIDEFKNINDRYGHVFGDRVIQALGSELKSHFRESDVVGRVGGDEFVVLMRNYTSIPAVRERMERLCARISEIRLEEHPEYRVCVSIGAALSILHGSSYEVLYQKADQALYFSKSHGKGTFTIYADKADDKISYMVNQRDMEALIHTATDGISKVACMGDEFKLLYFNAARAALTGTPVADLADPALDVLGQIHPDDLPGALAVFHSAMPVKTPFAVDLRLRHHDGHWFPVRLRGLFVSELYEGKYPIFYAVYTDLSARITPPHTPDEI